MIYLGLHKENRYILSYCAATFSSLFSKYCWHSLTLPLLLPTSTYFFTSVITWLVVNGEENELPQGIYQASLGHTVTNSKISMAQHSRSLFLPRTKTSMGHLRLSCDSGFRFPPSQDLLSQYMLFRKKRTWIWQTNSYMPWPRSMIVSLLLVFYRLK